jgi:hypothetical protein
MRVVDRTDGRWTAVRKPWGRYQVVWHQGDLISGGIAVTRRLSSADGVDERAWKRRVNLRSAPERAAALIEPRISPGRPANSLP